MFFLHGYALYTCLWLVKCSIVAFYARLCWNTSRMYRIATYITYFILGASFVTVIIYKTFNCYPLVDHHDLDLTTASSLGSVRSVHWRSCNAVYKDSVSDDDLHSRHLH